MLDKEPKYLIDLAQREIDAVLGDSRFYSFDLVASLAIINEQLMECGKVDKVEANEFEEVLVGYTNLRFGPYLELGYMSFGRVFQDNKDKVVKLGDIIKSKDFGVADVYALYKTIFDRLEKNQFFVQQDIEDLWLHLANNYPKLGSGASLSKVE